MTPLKKKKDRTFRRNVTSWATAAVETLFHRVPTRVPKPGSIYPSQACLRALLFPLLETASLERG